MSKPITLHFNNESRPNLQESRINEELQQEDEALTTYEHFDICEIL